MDYQKVDNHPEANSSNESKYGNVFEVYLGDLVDDEVSDLVEHGSVLSAWISGVV